MKAVIFDMDGVLIDSFENHWKAFDIVMKRNFGFNISREEFLGYFGSDPREIARKLIAKHDIQGNPDVFRIHAEKKEEYRRLSAKKVKMLPGVESLLASLKKEGWKTALASSSSIKEINPAMEKTKLDNFFDIIVSIEDVEKGKPNPDLFLKAAERLKVKPGECWVVEDSLPGVQAGKKAGMKVIGVQTGFRTKQELQKAGADIILENLEELEIEDLKMANE